MVDHGSGGGLRARPAAAGSSDARGVDAGATRRAGPEPAPRAALLLIAASLCAPGHAVAAEPALSFRSPFQAEQCERAIAFADNLLQREPRSRRGLRIRAEGLVCKGLDDDPWALDAAIDMLRRAVAEDPADFFAQLELADALRQRFPLSDEAQSALQRAQRLLRGADLGAARSDLANYIAANAQGMIDYRRRMLPFLRRRAQGYTAGVLSPAEMAQLVSLLVLTGIEGLARAEQYLDAYLAARHDDALSTLYRAEILRGRASRSVTRVLYTTAATRLCGTDALPARARSDCALARSRLKQLDDSQGGDAPGRRIAATRKEGSTMR